MLHQIAPLLRPLAILAALAVTFVAGYGFGQSGPAVKPPTETKGQSAVELRSLDLTDELDTVKGRPLRMRVVTLQPGGVLGIHSHKDRPAITYLLSGQMTYRAEGKPDAIVNIGGGFAEGRATTHWAENRGTVPAVWVAVDIPKP
jgi:quercetin dioxygenase-like cupin family protein